MCHFTSTSLILYELEIGNCGSADKRDREKEERDNTIQWKDYKQEIFLAWFGCLVDTSGINECYCAEEF